MQSKAIYAANWLKAKGYSEPVQDIVTYIVEMEATMSGLDSDYFREVSGKRGDNSGITIRKEKFKVNGRVVEGIKVEIGEELGLNPVEVMRSVAEQLIKEADEHTAKQNAATRATEPTEGDSGEKQGDGEQAPDGEPVDPKKWANQQYIKELRRQRRKKNGRS